MHGSILITLLTFLLVSPVYPTETISCYIGTKTKTVLADGFKECLYMKSVDTGKIIYRGSTTHSVDNYRRSNCSVVRSHFDTLVSCLCDFDRCNKSFDDYNNSTTQN